MTQTKKPKKKKKPQHKKLSNRARNALHYARFMTKSVTVKHARADLGQKRTIFRALHRTYNIDHFGQKVGVGVVMCMTQESVCRNLKGGDLDSVGAYQQRAAWGSYDERHNIDSATHMFLNGGHEGQRGWRQWFGTNAPTDRSLGTAVQDIQVSAFPTAYEQWEGEAQRTVQTWLSTRV